MAGPIPGGSPGGAAAGIAANLIPKDLQPNDLTFTNLGANAGLQGAGIGLAVDGTVAAGKKIADNTIGLPKKLVNGAVVATAGIALVGKHLEQQLNVAHGRSTNMTVSDATGKEIHGMPNNGGSLGSTKNGSSRLAEITTGAMKARSAAAQGIEAAQHSGMAA